MKICEQLERYKYLGAAEGVDARLRRKSERETKRRITNVWRRRRLVLAFNKKNTRILKKVNGLIFEEGKHCVTVSSTGYDNKTWYSDEQRREVEDGNGLKGFRDDVDVDMFFRRNCLDMMERRGGGAA